MQILQNILYKVGLLAVHGTLELELSQVDSDSRTVKQNSVFVAVKGTQVDGHEFIAKAIELGAIAIVCEVMPEDRVKGVTYVQVKDSHQALALLAANFYGNPSRELKMIGVTGTNGKTTTTTLLHDVFTDLGYKSGLLSTVVNKIGEKEIPATHTTPNPIALNALLREMVDERCLYCFMEVSSHAIHQNRVAGLDFDIAGFTNISHDHLDYHKTFKEYIYAKKKLFDDLSSNATAIINSDDSNGVVMVQNSKATVKTMALARHHCTWQQKTVLKQM